MTRVNYYIPVESLHDSHLFSEFRELPRIPRKVKKFIRDGKRVNTFNGDFKLGENHVRFFYDKLKYLHSRYDELFQESLNRGFSWNYDDQLFDINDFSFRKYYNPCELPREESVIMVKERIATRIRSSKQHPRYYRKDIEKEDYIKNILRYEN